MLLREEVSQLQEEVHLLRQMKEMLTKDLEETHGSKSTEVLSATELKVQLAQKEQELARAKEALQGKSETLPLFLYPGLSVSCLLWVALLHVFAACSFPSPLSASSSSSLSLPPPPLSSSLFPRLLEHPEVRPKMLANEEGETAPFLLTAGFTVTLEPPAFIQGKLEEAELLLKSLLH